MLTITPQVNIPPDWPIEEYKDIEGLGYYHEVARQTDNDPKALAQVVKNLSILGRDNARTPMQWDASPHAGFTEAGGAVPWMRVNDSYTDINVAKQLAEPDSVLKFWKDMIRFRKTHCDLLIYGAFEVLDLQGEETFVFVKSHGGEKAVVALNFSNSKQQVDLPGGEGEFLLQVSNYTHSNNEAETKVSSGSRVTLQPWEGQLYIHQNTSP